MDHFASEVEVSIGCYVYALIDPRDSRVFYVGKGTGSRVFAHANGVAEDDFRDAKLESIKSIKDAGLKVRHMIVRHGLSDPEALAVESALIDFAELVNHPLTNQKAGHGASAFGLISAELLQARHLARPLGMLDPDKMIVNLNRRFRESKSGSSIYDLARGSWDFAGSRKDEIRFVMAEYRGVIVEIFHVDSWEAEGNRWRFVGEIADEAVRRDFVGKKVEKRRGSANPVRFNLP